MSTPRAALLADLKAVLPARWKFIDTEENFDQLDTVAVLVRQTEIRRLPAAPQGAHIVDYLIIVLDPSEDLKRAEHALDDEVDDVLHAIDGSHIVGWNSARKALYNNQYLSYEIEAFTASGKDEG